MSRASPHLDVDTLVIEAVTAQPHAVVAQIVEGGNQYLIDKKLEGHVVKGPQRPIHV